MSILLKSTNLICVLIFYFIIINTVIYFLDAFFRFILILKY